MPEHLELLSPAGSLDALQAAIAAGADAIYLGAAAHGARASVGFDDQALETAIRTAHLHGKRVYVTVNTLVKEQELPQLKDLLTRLVLLRADAVIVQDLGLASLIGQQFPGLVLHASTQMSIHNASGAKLMQQLGFARVVLARECSLPDIQAVADTGIETEVFVHGALCIAQSGQCLFSSQIGGRSGNRGRCAQPCRLNYRYRDQEGALLSPRDLNTLEQIPQLIKAGISSFKIEGRLKRPEYVYVVTQAYRQAIDAALAGKPLHDLHIHQDALTRVFSRGFTKGYAFLDQDKNLMSLDTVGHQGVLVAEIKSVAPRDGFYLAQAKMKKALAPGDGLQIRGQDSQEIVYSGPTVPQNQVAVLRLRKPAKPGDTVYRTLDETQLSAARQGSQLPQIPFAATLNLAPGQPASLMVKARGQAVSVAGDLVSKAQNAPLLADSARKQVAKTGSTPFVLRDFAFVNTEPAFLPAASLNQLRRDALLLLEEALITNHALPQAPVLGDAVPASTASFASLQKFRLYALVHPQMDRDALLSAGADQLLFALDNYRTDQLPGQLDTLQPGDTLLLPRQVFDEDLQQITSLTKQRGIRLMADNIGQLYPDDAKDLCTISGEGIPAWNSHTLAKLKALGVHSAVLSRELSLQEIADLPKDILELILPVYGRAQLMQLNHCPQRVYLGLSANRAKCRLCQQGQGLLGQHLTDRFDCQYPLVPTHFDRGCLISLYHHKPLHLSQQAPTMSWLLDLRLDAHQEALAITRHYADLLAGKQPLPLSIVPEAGRALLGVE